VREKAGSAISPYPLFGSVPALQAEPNAGNAALQREGEQYRRKNRITIAAPPSIKYAGNPQKDNRLV
jgi:hypothetical protein